MVQKGKWLAWKQNESTTISSGCQG